MLGPPRGLRELESTDLGTQSQEEGTPLKNVQVVGVDHEAEAAGGCQACMGCMHGTHAWDTCMGRMHGKMHVHFLPGTAQLCHA